MRTFFLFYVLSYLLRNPLLALVIVGVIFYLGEARYRGRWFDPSRLLKRRQAISSLRSTLAVNEHDVGAHSDLGRMLVQEGKLDDALPHLERAIARMEESPETNYYLGLCQLGTGSKKEGQHHIERALEINPRFLYGEPQVVLARHNLAEGRAEESCRWAREAVKLNTSSVEGWVVRGEAEQACGRAAEATAAYQSARDAYRHLPGYLKLPNRKWLAEAKRAAARA